MTEKKGNAISEIWSRWDEITGRIPKEAKELADAYVKREREDLPVSPGLRHEDLKPTEWLEAMILDGDTGLDLLLHRMLYAAWRLGEGFLLGGGWRRRRRRALRESERVSLCRKIGYSVEEVMEETALIGPKQDERTSCYVFGEIAEALYIQYPHEQLTAYLENRFCQDGLPGFDEESRWRLWMDGELLGIFLAAHDPDAAGYIPAFLSCLEKFPVLNMDDLLLRLALNDPLSRRFLLTRSLQELEQMSSHSGWTRRKACDDLVDEVIRKRQREALEELSHLTDTRELTRWLKILYERAQLTDLSPLPKLLGHRAGSVRMLAEKILYRHLDEAHLLLQKTRTELQGEALQLARQILAKWEETDSVKRQKKLFQDREALELYCQQHLLPAAGKKAAWVPREWFDQVRYADSSGKVPEIVLEYLFVRYLSLAEPERLEIADQIVAFFDPQDLQALLTACWQFWLLEDCDPKHRLLVLLCGIYASDPLMLQMEKGAEMLALKKRGEMAESVICALGKNGSPTALMILERQACGKGRRKPRMAFARVEQAAQECFQQEATRLGISWDTLADRVVSCAGFDRKGEQKLDMEERMLTIRLMPDLSLQVKDEKGAWRKSFPKPRKEEDPERFEAARLQFTGLKHQVKTIYETQLKRLERVMRTGRSWQKEDWEHLFLENPILHLMASRLIWGLYEEERLTDTFCCLEDGTLSTAEDDAFLLPQNAKISLAHPVELSAEIRERWRQRMEDYEILPLFGQLEEPFGIGPEQIDQNGMLLLWDGRISSTSRLQTLQTRYGAVPEGQGYILMEEGIGGIRILAEESPWDHHGPITLEKAVLLNAAKEPCLPDALPERFVSSMAGLIDANL